MFSKCLLNLTSFDKVAIPFVFVKLLHPRGNWRISGMLYLPCVLDHFHLHSKAAEFEIEAGFLKHFHISQSSGDPSVYVIDSMPHVLRLITRLICTKDLRGDQTYYNATPSRSLSLCPGSKDTPLSISRLILTDFLAHPGKSWPHLLHQEDLHHTTWSRKSHTRYGRVPRLLTLPSFMCTVMWL